MKGLCVDGPNKGTIVDVGNLPNKTNTFKILDPSERFLSYKIDDVDPLTPLKVNTYYRYPTNPFAQAYGFDVLYRYQSSGR